MPLAGLACCFLVDWHDECLHEMVESVLFAMPSAKIVSSDLRVASLCLVLPSGRSVSVSVDYVDPAHVTPRGNSTFTYILLSNNPLMCPPYAACLLWAILPYHQDDQFDEKQTKIGPPGGAGMVPSGRRTGMFFGYRWMMAWMNMDDHLLSRISSGFLWCRSKLNRHSGKQIL